MNCACGGGIIAESYTPRDGKRAMCARCYGCVPIDQLLNIIDEQAEVIARAEPKISRLYQRGQDLTAALKDERDLLRLGVDVFLDFQREVDQLTAALRAAEDERAALLVLRDTISHRLMCWDMGDSDGHSESRRLRDALHALRDLAALVGKDPNAK